MDRYICIHGHFYQPPRENPWLEAIEIQDSAFPYHDWNEKVNAECYAPNSASRVLDAERRIMDIVNNYSRISFNFGPTLLSWMEVYAPDIYRAILDADRQSMEWRSGHGNAIAQIYNHIIMPLANTRDKRTQILWGIKDFEYRFKRSPEGMWLSETAVDMETLDMLAEHGIKFTILAPHQAFRVRKLSAEKWKDVSGGRIDPTRAYLCKLPSGRTINIFFYDGPISQAVAFENLLNRGEDFANRLLGGFSDTRKWPQILNIATDGESYGHHHRYGGMALTFVLNHIENNKLAKLTNYGEYLEKHPSAHEIQIHENTSWSCMHGIERWKSNCGCKSGGPPEWSQEWRGPLRDAMDWLRDQLVSIYENKAKEYLKNPWEARDEYIGVILNRSQETIDRFIARHATKNLNEEERIIVLKLLEIQRHAMLMYTSCGWFFADISGLETVQIMEYAGRTIQLSKDLITNDLESAFQERLSKAKSNFPEHRDGAHIYEGFVKPTIIDLKEVGVHFAVSSLFETYAEMTKIYCYVVAIEDYQKVEAGRMSLAIGRILVTSGITGKSEHMIFSGLHLGNHDFNGGVSNFPGNDEYQSMKGEMIAVFKKGALADIVRMMDKHFGMHNYSLRDLFKDQQRKILNQVISSTIQEFEDTYRDMYENNCILMGFLQETGIPIPKAFYTAADFILNVDLKTAFGEEIDTEKIHAIINDMKKWHLTAEPLELEYKVRHKAEEMMNKFGSNLSDISLLLETQKVIELLHSLPIEINFWFTQNIYFKIAKTQYKEFLSKQKSGDKDAARWVEVFKQIGHNLFFNITAVLPED
ncbi:MAG: DUF3536 domain-containing protein [Candidatus Brocadia sp.]|nr:DUF3536 domain-containing protein [Candidatus Brocadia sp.]